MKYNASIFVNDSHQWLFNIEAESESECRDYICKLFNKDKLIINNIKPIDSIDDMIDIEIITGYSQYINEGD